MQIQFGTNTSANEAIHKNVSLNDAVECVVKDPINVITPYVVVKSSDINLSDNYAYCEEYDRYYFIVINELPGGRCGVQCTVDPLMSFADDIDAREVNIERYEGATESDIYDNGVCQTARNEVVIETFSGGDFAKASDNNARTYILTVAN